MSKSTPSNIRCIYRKYDYYFCCLLFEHQLPYTDTWLHFQQFYHETNSFWLFNLLVSFALTVLQTYRYHRQCPRGEPAHSWAVIFYRSNCCSSSITTLPYTLNYLRWWVEAWLLVGGVEERQPCKIILQRSRMVTIQVFITCNDIILKPICTDPSTSPWEHKLVQG